MDLTWSPEEERFRADAIAGLTVAIIALPLSMAIAIASGVSPELGLVTAVVADRRHARIFRYLHGELREEGVLWSDAAPADGPAAGGELSARPPTGGRFAGYQRDQP